MSESIPMAELVEWTSSVAADVQAGLYDVRADADERWLVRLYCDDQVDLWLISWTTDQGTQLHDHGGSSGAFTVVEGELTESSWVDGPGILNDQERGTGDTVVFGPHYVHDVRNTKAQTAVSVHAYSPPLSTMSFYDVEDHRLVRLAQLWTDDPEEQLPADVAEQRKAS